LRPVLEMSEGKINSKLELEPATESASRSEGDDLSGSNRLSEEHQLQLQRQLFKKIDIWFVGFYSLVSYTGTYHQIVE
jgi:hypothetical protein